MGKRSPDHSEENTGGRSALKEIVLSKLQATVKLYLPGDLETDVTVFEEVKSHPRNEEDKGGRTTPRMRGGEGVEFRRAQAFIFEVGTAQQDK